MKPSEHQREIDEALKEGDIKRTKEARARFYREHRSAGADNEEE